MINNYSGQYCRLFRWCVYDVACKSYCLRRMLTGLYAIMHGVQSTTPHCLIVFQLLPYYVMTIFVSSPGFAGLFLATLYGGSLRSESVIQSSVTVISFCSVQLRSSGLTENAGVENAAPSSRGGKRGSGKRGTKFRGVFRISS